MLGDVVVDVEGGLGEGKLFDHVLTRFDCLFHLGIDSFEVCENLMKARTLLVVELQHLINKILPQRMEFGI